jgi:energy-coupling factor transporter ATP-binding protein EcfA2
MIVAFGGRAGSGKSTAAMLLRSLLPQKIVVLSFATPVKAIASIVGGSDCTTKTDKNSTPPTLADTDLTWRRLLQIVGTEFGRNMLHPEIWIRLAERTMDRELAKGNIVVFDDMRFENELRFIKQRGGHTVLVDRNLPAMDHPSEQLDFVELFDRTILNTGSLTDLQAAVVELALDLQIISMTGGTYQIEMPLAFPP